MEFTGRYPIPAPPQQVWDALNDPAVLKACVPGCQSLTRADDHRFDAVATLRIGPVKANFKAIIRQTELEPPRRCVLKGEGQGGVAGFARGEAEVTLAQDGDVTVLSYLARGNIGGKLAQVGQRLIDSAAKQIADDFFRRFAAQISAGPLVAEQETVAPAAPPPLVETPAPPPKTGSREGLAPEIWVIGLIGVIVILLVLFGVAL
jgi:carbon monoxide dehydrogenase subunit G